jgi:glycosyltransferase involved in cell wall biosynthesis
MTKIGLLLSAGPGGGVLQYSQAIVDAALALPPEYSLCAAIADPLWEGVLPQRFSLVRLEDTFWNRALNKLSHASRLPVALWRRSLAILDTNVTKLLDQRCDLWVCPNHDRYAFRAPIKALGTVHDLMHRYERRFPEVSEGGEFESREFHFSETAKWSRGILVDSETGKRHVMDSYGVPGNRVFVLPYVAPSYIYTYDGADDAIVRAKYDLPAKFLFYPAQFYKHKNHANLLEALAKLRVAHPEVRLALVGAKERNGYEEVRQRVEQLGLHDNVLFLGYAPDKDMAALYSTARALVMPTYFGPTNIPQLEAFALGCPVATSRIYGIPEQVGDAALLFDPSSVDEIYDCIRRLWTDDALCAELARRGRVHATSWGPQQFRSRFREIIEALT